MYCLRIWTPLQITNYMILYPLRCFPWVKDHVLGYLKRCPNAKAIHGRDGLYYIDRADHKNGQCTFADPSKGIIGAYADCPWRTREQISVCTNNADRKSTRLNSSHQIISYAVFCLKKKKHH